LYVARLLSLISFSLWETKILPISVFGDH